MRFMFGSNKPSFPEFITALLGAIEVYLPRSLHSPVSLVNKIPTNDLPLQDSSLQEKIYSEYCSLCH